MQFGEFIWRRRKYLGIKSQKDLAKRAALSVFTIGCVERGEANAARMKPTNITALAHALNIEPDRLHLWAYVNDVPPDAPERTDLKQVQIPLLNPLDGRQIMVALQHRGLIEFLLEDENISVEIVDTLLAVELATTVMLTKETCRSIVANLLNPD